MNTFKEIWKSVNGYPNYEVSNLGRIRNSAKNRILKLSKVNGYAKIDLCNKNGTTTFRAHRLVAEVFCPNKSEINCEINHIDGVKDHNWCSNLEWVTRLDNVRHAHDTGLCRSDIPINVIDINKGKCGIRDLSGKYNNAKAFSAMIDVRFSNIAGYIKYSHLFPFMDRFKLTAPQYTKISNTVRGDVTYVYDSIENTLIKYPSANMAAIYTGVKGVCNLRDNKPINVAGYVLSKEPIDDLSKYKSCTLEERMRYMATPYKRKPVSYAMYNYDTKEETKYNTLPDLVNGLLKITNNSNVNKRTVANAISDAKRVGRTGLIAGYGVAAILEGDASIVWTIYPEAYMYNNKINRLSRFPVYVVNNNGTKTIYPVTLLELAVVLKEYLPEYVLLLKTTSTSLDRINKELPKNIHVTRMPYEVNSKIT